MKQLVNGMAENLARGESFALATVITRNGSAPRSAGAKMLVRPDGSTLGTVGGGILEAQIEQLAAEIIRSHSAVVRSFAFSGKDAATMDAICGGQVEVLVEWIDPANPQTVAAIRGLQAAVEGHHKVWLLTSLPSGADACAQHILVRADGTSTAPLPPGIICEEISEIRQPVQLPAGEQSLMVEPLDISGTTYIFGAGHVSRSLAEFTRAVGFWTVVLDDRPDFASRPRFPSADELVILDQFQDCMSKVAVDRDSYIVIVTRGHLHDRIVLAQALKTNAGYIGMIGSRRKTALIYEELRKIGFTDADLARVHAPIGLPISAETPEEIGISIVAEMIQARARLHAEIGTQTL
jgi:xanthine dehydrogenase accessory factor